MRLAKADFRKVGPFKELSLEFKENKRKDLAEVHIFTGPNGSGKSTTLKLLAYSFANAGIDNVPVKKLFHTSGQNGSWAEVYDTNGSMVSIASSGKSDDDITVMAEGNGESAFNVYRKKALFYNASDKSSEFEFAVFGYSGQRFLNSEAKFSFGIPEINPFVTAIDFERSKDSPIPLANWAGNILAKVAFASTNRDSRTKVEASKTLRTFESLLHDITSREIEFNVDYEVMQNNLILDGVEVGFDVLPDGLKSMLGWLGDMLMRMESIRWKEKCSVFEQPIILFLDEIDIHLHPEWQRRILPIIQKTFVNAQIFVSTHSPFVVASVEDAFVYDLNINKEGEAFLEQVVVTEKGHSYARVLREIFDVESDFVDPWTERKLKDFYSLLQTVRSKGSADYDKTVSIGKSLAETNVELRDLVAVELSQLNSRINA
jgi:predicted ATP-binding protein involved in virulence